MLVGSVLFQYSNRLMSPSGLGLPVLSTSLSISASAGLRALSPYLTSHPSGIRSSSVSHLRGFVPTRNSSRLTSWSTSSSSNLSLGFVALRPNQISQPSDILSPSESQLTGSVP